MAGSYQKYNVKYDLTNCDAEPLRFIRCCQGHARLLVLNEADLRLLAYSENWPSFSSHQSESPIGQVVEDLLPEDFCRALRLHFSTSQVNIELPLSFNFELADGSTRPENVICHQQGSQILLEFEPRINDMSGGEFMLKVDQSLRKIQACNSLAETFQTVVKEVKSLTGFDRVMLYEFDADYNGEVVAEALHSSLAPFLGLRYPHTDIPRQARELFLKMEIRQIVSSKENEDALLISDSDSPLDLGQAENRGVSPIHLEYLRTMKVGASMSIAISFNNRLWGLIACHHQTERLIDYRLRQILKFLARVISGHIALQKGAGYEEEIRRTSEIRSNLVRRMNETLEIQKTLLDEKFQLQRLIKSAGVGVLLNGTYALTGEGPNEKEVKGLVELLTTKEESCWHTNTLFEAYPPSRDFARPMAGVLALRLTREPAEYILWFRPETVQTVEWGGRPDHRKLMDKGKVKLHPELSFQKWTELVKDKAIPWKTHQVDAAMAFRNDLKEVVMKKFQQVNDLNNKLITAYDEMESFSYTVSHDLRAPLRNIKGYAKILEEDYAGSLDEYGRSALKVIIDNVGKMNQFIFDMLEFSRLGRSEVKEESVALLPLIEGVWEEVHRASFSVVELKLELDVPEMKSGTIQLRQIFSNFLSNAIKYARNIDEPWVKIRSFKQNETIVIEIADNGIGFNMKHAESIFTVFNRLVSDSKYEGSGVGLAIVKNMVEKLKGTISVKSTPGVGTVFSLNFPDLDESSGQSK